MGKTTKDTRWHVLRCSGRQELKLRYELERFRIECFVPLMRRYRMKRNRRVLEVKAAVAGIVFARLDEEQLADFQEKSQIRCFPWKDCATGSPVVVSDSDMRNFIGVAGTFDEQLIYLDPNPQNWTKGQRVRIVAGPMKGYEGRFVRVKGDRRVVVEVPGIIAVATGFMHPSFVEPITDEEATDVE